MKIVGATTVSKNVLKKNLFLLKPIHGILQNTNAKQKLLYRSYNIGMVFHKYGT